MIKLINIQNIHLAELVLHVQKPAYEVEAKLMNFYDIPPLHETVESLSRSTEMFFGYWVEESLAGVISIEEDDQQNIQICRLVVHPNFFRQGIAKQLVQYIFEQYDKTKTFFVSTGERNIPAKKLYSSLGFSEVKQIEISPNIFLTCFKKSKIHD